LNLAVPTVQATAYQLILNRCIGDYHLPDGWIVISAGNRLEDRANVFETPAPLNNRFLHIELATPDVDEWIDWSVANNIDTRISTFLKFKPSLLYKFDKTTKDKAFPTPRCIKGDSKVLMANGIWKNISEIKIGEEVIGFENGNFVVSTVLNTFKNDSIKTKYEINDGKNQLVCSGEHKFITDIGYVKAMNLKREIPVYVYGELSILDKGRGKISDRKLSKKNSKGNSFGIKQNSKGSSAENTSNAFAEMEFFTKDFIDSDGIELYGRFIGWGRQYLLLSKKERGENILRTSNTNTQLFSFICGMVQSERIHNNRGKKEGRMAKQIHSENVWFWNEQSIKIVDAILADKKTTSIVDDTIYRKKKGYYKRDEIFRNGRIEKIKGNIKAIEHQATSKAISIRKGNNSEIFYDLMTTSKNYIANGFITHNSWAFCSEMISDKDTKDRERMEILIASCIGEATAMEFMGWLRLNDKLNIDAILKNPLEAKLPSEIDLTYVMVSGILEHYKKDKKLLKPIVQIATRLQAEFAVLMLKLIKVHNPRFVQDVVVLPEWTKNGLAKKLQPYFEEEKE
jgi:disulfide oxidoreductase YuzD